MGKKFEYDFSGWATKVNVRCADGVTIKPGAFDDCDGTVVPVVWNHQHDSIDNVLGHALLKCRPEGVYVYGSLNEGESGQAARIALKHGDIGSLSILANKIRKSGSDVVHGIIREVSLVLAGANPEAVIDTVLAHSEEEGAAAIMGGFDDEDIQIKHGVFEEEEMKEENGILSHAEEPDSEETIEDVFNTLTDKQKTAVYAMIGAIVEGEDEDEDEGGDQMAHHLFEREDEKDDGVLMHDAMNAIIGDAKRFGSMKESFLQHAETYGIDQIEYLYPDAKTMQNTPEFIQRDMGWVTKVMNAVHHSPFSRVKSIFADITEDDARAKGYLKGKLKKEEVFGLLKRTTTPTTVYKKQKMDRDDVIDITDFDVVSWLKGEMRKMLDEEIARAILIGDGRPTSSDDKISEEHIRPIMKDEELFAIQAKVNVQSADAPDVRAKEFIKTAIRARKDYKGSGQPSLFTTEDMLTEMLLLEDGIGRTLYADEAALARKLRVREIITVPVMEGVRGKDNGNLLGIIVNMADYNIGADKGGAINMFEDFDIDYNQQKYLIETRCSGALVKPYSAIVLEEKIGE